jgi:hypothetical protein
MTNTDPRDVPGSMSGPGGPHDRGGVLLDADRAVLLAEVDVSIVEPVDNSLGEALVALALSGRINLTQDQASVLFLLRVDGAAALVSEIIAVIGRTGDQDLKDAFSDALDRRFERLKEDGNLYPKDVHEG